MMRLTACRSSARDVSRMSKARRLGMPVRLSMRLMRE